MRGTIKYEVQIAKCRTVSGCMVWLRKARQMILDAAVSGGIAAEADAKRIRLLAYRRLNEIAESEQPRKYLKGRRSSQLKGPRAFLRKHGLSETTAYHVRRIGRIPPAEFNRMLANPCGITKASEKARGIGTVARSTDAWRHIQEGRATASISLARFVKRFCRHTSPRAMARQLSVAEARRARAFVLEAANWLASFDEALKRRGDI